jgi:hypothetical protein
VRYEAVIDGHVAQRATSDLEAITYLAEPLLPVRRGVPQARRQFRGLRGSTSSPP